MKNKTVQTVYIAPAGFEQELAAELSSRGLRTVAERGRLFLCAGVPEDVYWAHEGIITPTQFIDKA